MFLGRIKSGLLHVIHLKNKMEEILHPLIFINMILKYCKEYTTLVRILRTHRLCRADSRARSCGHTFYKGTVDTLSIKEPCLLLYYYHE